MEKKWNWKAEGKGKTSGPSNPGIILSIIIPNEVRNLSFTKAVSFPDKRTFRCLRR